MLESVGLGDIFRVWALAREQGFGFHFVGIPVDYELGLAADFEPERARKLFDLGYRMGLKPDRWETVPPWLDP
jgi:hypothetical protein